MAEFDITAQITNIFTNYFENIKNEVSEAVDEVGAELLEDIKDNSPVGDGARGGKYKRGWTTKTETDRYGSKTVTVYNKTDYQLTHLLENGHRMVTHRGRVVGHVAAKPHIKPAEERAVEKLEKRVEEILEDAD